MWPDLKFPPLNLFSMPKNVVLVEHHALLLDPDMWKDTDERTTEETPRTDEEI